MSGATIVATLEAVLGADISQFTKQLGRATRQTHQFSKGFTGSLGSVVTGALNRVGMKITDTFAALPGVLKDIGKSVINTAGDFEAGMKRIEAIGSEAGGVTFDMLREKAKQLGRDTKFSAKEAADAMGFLSMAGFDTKQVFESIGPTLSLATAGTVDLGRAADITSNIMAGFGIEAGDVAGVADVLTVTITNANTTLEQLGQGLKFLAPAARAAGQSLEEMSALMGILGGAGLQAGVAGRGLRRALSKLVMPNVQESLKELGVNVLNASGEMRPFHEIITQLQASQKKLGNNTKFLGEMTQIFGSIASTSVLALVNSGDAVDKLRTKIDAAGGAAEKTGKKMLEGFAGATTILGSSLEGLQIELGEAGFLGVAESFVEVVTQVVNGLAEWIKTNDTLKAILAGTRIFIEQLGKDLATIWDNPGLTNDEKVRQTFTILGAAAADAFEQVFLASAQSMLEKLPILGRFAKSQLEGKGFLESLNDATIGTKEELAALAKAAGAGAMASGGIVRGPQLALVGEAGPEAVVPLSNGNPFSKLADMLGVPAMATGGIVTPAELMASFNQPVAPKERGVVGGKSFETWLKKAMAAAFAKGGDEQAKAFKSLTGDTLGQGESVRVDKDGVIVIEEYANELNALSDGVLPASTKGLSTLGKVLGELETKTTTMAQVMDEADIDSEPLVDSLSELQSKLLEMRDALDSGDVESVALFGATLEALGQNARKLERDFNSTLLNPENTPQKAHGRPSAPQSDATSPSDSVGSAPAAPFVAAPVISTGKQAGEFAARQMSSGSLRDFLTKGRPGMFTAGIGREKPAARMLTELADLADMIPGVQQVVGDVINETERGMQNAFLTTAQALGIDGTLLKLAQHERELELKRLNDDLADFVSGVGGASPRITRILQEMDGASREQLKAMRESALAAQMVSSFQRDSAKTMSAEFAREIEHAGSRFSSAIGGFSDMVDSAVEAVREEVPPPQTLPPIIGNAGNGAPNIGGVGGYTPIVINVEGSVISEDDLIQTVARGLQSLNDGTVGMAGW